MRTGSEGKASSVSKKLPKIRKASSGINKSFTNMAVKAGRKIKRGSRLLGGKNRCRQVKDFLFFGC